MNKKEFNKLPLGTVLLYELSADYYIDVKTSKNFATCVETGQNNKITVGEKILAGPNHRIAPPSIQKLYNQNWLNG